MQTTPAFVSGRKPPLPPVLIIAAVLLATWGWFHLAVFSDHSMPLTYTLPLMLGVWHRRHWLMWSMAVVCLILAIIEIVWVTPDSNLPLKLHWVAFAGQAVNIVVAGGVIQAIMLWRQRQDAWSAALEASNTQLGISNLKVNEHNRSLEESNVQLAAVNRELIARENEISAQNEELQSQSEELAKQNEELEQQSEELQAQSEELHVLNEEMTRRESMLQALLESARSLVGEQQVMTDICRTGLRLIGGQATAGAVVERRGQELVVHAHVGFGADGPAHQHWPFTQSFAALVMKHGRTAFLEDIGLRPDLQIPQPRADKPLRSILATPLRAKGTTVGAVEFYSATAQQWTQEQFRLAEWVADQCSLILDVLRLQKALRDTSQRLRFHMENSPLAVVEWDSDYRITGWTEAAERVFGWTVQEVVGKRIDELRWVHEEDHDKVAQVMADMLSGARPRNVNPNRNYRKDGSIIWCEWYNSALRDEAGNLVSVLSLVLDVTARKTAEEAMRSLSLFPEENPSPVLRIAQDGSLLFTNAAGEVFLAGLGWRHGDPVPEALFAATQATMRAGFAREMEIQAGQGPLFSLAFSPIPAAAYVNVYGRDISGLKRIQTQLQQAKEAAESASQAKDQFIAVLSHELRTPLTPVLLTASLLENHPQLPKEFHNDIQTIRRNVELEARLIDDLLDVTRVARGKMQFDMQPADLHLLIRAAADTSGRGEGAAICLQLHAEHQTVYGDPARLQQVIWNLLNNARKFTPADGRITVHTTNADGRITMEVSDTGIGIEPEFIPKIFDAFEQGDAGLARKLGGLGLGLAISKAIMDAHGGCLRAVSQGKGQGSTFSLEMPTHATPDLSSTDIPPQTEQALPPRRLHILLVEDHASTLFVMTKLVGAFGHDVQTATSIESAMQVARQHRFDLVISDLGLPDGSGHQLMCWLKQHYGLPGIALSGYGMEEDVRKSGEAGFIEHLTKPIDLRRLEAAIARVAVGCCGERSLSD